MKLLQKTPLSKAHHDLKARMIDFAGWYTSILEEHKMNPKEYKYTREHEWICPRPGNKGRTGLTDYAQSHLGDIVFLDLPAPGTQVKQFGKMGEIESVKTVSDLFSPVSGEVLEINQAAIDEPKLVNEDPYGAGWLVELELSKPSELNALMNSDEYDKFVAKLSQENSE